MGSLRPTKVGNTQNKKKLSLRFLLCSRVVSADRRLNMVSTIFAVFSLLCLDLTSAAPKSQKGTAAAVPINRPDDIECNPVTYWDCQSSKKTSGLPSCGHEEVCSNVNGKTECRRLPTADKCKVDSFKVCTKKTGETCMVIKTNTPADPLDLPVSNSTSPNNNNDVGCTIGEETVCEEANGKLFNFISKLPECGEVGTVCKYVNGKAECSDVTPKKCRSETGKLCTKLPWTVCGAGTSEESEVIIGGE